MDVTVSQQAKPIIFFGSLFVGALKGIAPILVFLLVMLAISQHRVGHQTDMKASIVLYLLETFLAQLKIRHAYYVCA